MIYMVHEGKRAYECYSCSKLSFTLRRHNHTVHEARRDYECYSFDKFLIRKYVLKRHYYILAKKMISHNNLLHNWHL